MSEALVKMSGIAAWTHEQRDLIKRTVAPRDATDDEVAMFLHIAAQSGLDPLRRQIHFMKHSGRVTVVADINGLQARAAKEADYEGMLGAVVYEKDVFEVDNVTGTITAHTSNPLGSNGRIIGAWAVVRRKGMLPFVSIVRFAEYENSNNPLWKSKPAVMIHKVAKSTALRLAYPEQLGGIYERAEMDKAEGEATPMPEGQPPATRTEEVKGAIKAQMHRAAKVAKPSQMTIEDKTTTPTPWERIVAVCAKHGLVEGARVASVIKGATGKPDRKALTDSDVAKVEAALSAIASPATVPEPPVDHAPPPSEADAPPEQF